jgi:hypothetical protein
MGIPFNADEIFEIAEQIERNGAISPAPGVELQDYYCWQCAAIAQTSLERVGVLLKPRDISAIV